MQSILLLELIRSLHSREKSVRKAIDDAGCNRREWITSLQKEADDIVDFLCIQFSALPDLKDPSIPTGIRMLAPNLFQEESAYLESVVNHPRFQKTMASVTKSLNSKFSVSFFSPAKPQQQQQQPLKRSLSPMTTGRLFSPGNPDLVPGGNAAQKSKRSFSAMQRTSAENSCNSDQHRSSQSSRMNNSLPASQPMPRKTTMFITTTTVRKSGLGIKSGGKSGGGGGGSSLLQGTKTRKSPLSRSMSLPVTATTSLVAPTKKLKTSFIQASSFYGLSSDATTKGSSSTSSSNDKTKKPPPSASSGTCSTPKKQTAPQRLRNKPSSAARTGGKRGALLDDDRVEGDDNDDRDDDLLAMETPQKPHILAMETPQKQLQTPQRQHHPPSHILAMETPQGQGQGYARQRQQQQQQRRRRSMFGSELDGMQGELGVDGDHDHDDWNDDHEEEEGEEEEDDVLDTPFFCRTRRE